MFNPFNNISPRLAKWLIALSLVIIGQLVFYQLNKPIKIKDLGPISPELISVLQPTQDLYAINIFASWCGACREEHKILLHLNQILKLPIYGINVNEEPKNCEDFLAAEGNPYTKLIFFSFDKLKSLNMEKIPRTFIVKRGRIIYDQKGAFNILTLQYNVMPILSQAQEKK